MFLQSSLGIQVEKSQIAIVLARISLRGVHVSASETRAIDPDMPPKERGKYVAAQVNEFLGRSRVSPANIILGLPRESVILRNLTLPWAVKENLRATLSYEMEKYCPFTADDVYYDFQILGEDRKEGKLGILLCIARRDDVSPYFALKDLIGKGVREIGVSSMAIVNGLLDSQQNLKKQSFNLIYLAKEYVELGRVQDGLLVYSRIIDSHMNPQRGMDRLLKDFAQVQGTFGQKSDSEDVVICGPNADENLAGDISREGVNVVTLGTSPDNIHTKETLPAFGLALAGLKPTLNHTNLLPIELQKRPSKVPYYLMVILLITALLGGGAWWGSGIFQRRLYYEGLEREVDRMRSEAAKSVEVEKKCDGVGKSLADLSSRIAVKTPVLDILKELTERIPDNAWLTAFSFSKGKVTIRGYADTASELIPLLEASPLFRDVSFLSTIRKTRDGKEQFRIGFNVE